MNGYCVVQNLSLSSGRYDICYTPLPPGRKMRDCRHVEIEMKASMRHPLWVVVVYKCVIPKNVENCMRIPFPRSPSGSPSPDPTGSGSQQGPRGSLTILKGRISAR